MKSRAAGYTLVELLSVLAILGLVALLAWPRLEAAADQLALRQDAAVMARELRLARQKAITGGRECAVVFKPCTQNFSSTRYLVRQAGKERTIELRRGVETAWTRFPQDPVKLGDWSSCRFLPLGNPNQGGTIQLRNRRGRALYVVVTPVIGRVRIADTDPQI